MDIEKTEESFFEQFEKNQQCFNGLKEEMIYDFIKELDMQENKARD